MGSSPLPRTPHSTVIIATHGPTLASSTKPPLSLGLIAHLGAGGNRVVKPNHLAAPIMGTLGGTNPASRKPGCPVNSAQTCTGEEEGSSHSPVLHRAEWASPPSLHAAPCHVDASCRRPALCCPPPPPPPRPAGHVRQGRERQLQRELCVPYLAHSRASLRASLADTPDTSS